MIEFDVFGGAIVADSVVGISGGDVVSASGLLGVSIGGFSVVDDKVDIGADVVDSGVGTVMELARGYLLVLVLYQVLVLMYPTVEMLALQMLALVAASLVTVWTHFLLPMMSELQSEPPLAILVRALCLELDHSCSAPMYPTLLLWELLLFVTAYLMVPSYS